MNKKLLLAASIAGMAFIAGGCEELLADLDFGGDWLGNEESSIDVQQASILGELGPVGQMQAESASFDPGYDSGDYTSFNITGAGSEGEIMQIIEFDGGIYHPMLQTAGTEITNDCGEYRDGSDPTAPPLMRVTGCSADNNGGNWDYDQPCEEVTVEVEEHPEDPGVLMYTVTSEFENGFENQTVVSQFAIPRQDGVTPPESTVDENTRDEWVLGQVNGGRF